MTHTIIIIALTFVSVFLLYICSYKMLQIFQMSSYRNREVFAWLKKTRMELLARYFSLAFFGFVPTLMFVACFGRYEFFEYLGFAFFILMSIVFFVLVMRGIKVPLKFTNRVLRLSVTLVILYSAAAFPLIFFLKDSFVQYSLVTLLPFFIPFFVLLSGIINSPLEKLIARSFWKKAQKKLGKNDGLIKIGITGSFGKTTTKNILSAMLSKKYKVCASPKSYNTPMGLCKVINETLLDDDQILIAEMGARYTGDIAELCNLINPNIGVLTAIGDMHLETFGSKENIIKTKYELIDSLLDEPLAVKQADSGTGSVSGGMAVFSGDCKISTGLFESCEKNKLISNSEKSRRVCTYSNVSVGENGTSFDLKLDEKTVHLSTQLLGNHIPSLVALSALIASELNVTIEQIAEAVAELKPVPHRLELIKRHNMIVIDDAYNSNPDGAKNALNLLSAFGGTRIIITPGMIELGDESNRLHKEFGLQIAKCADYAILIGRNAALIKEGIIAAEKEASDEAKLQADKVIISKTLNEAMEQLALIPSENKVVLFENDLPDNY